MPFAVRASFGVGYSPAATNEQQWTLGANRSWIGKRPPLIYCHPAGGSANATVGGWGQSLLLHALAQNYLVVAADLGGDQWGNDTHLSRIDDALEFAASRGAVGSPVLVGASMGVLGALGYARANPGTVTAVAGIIPALDLADLYGRGFATLIDAAYPGGYDDAIDGPTRSPVQYAATLPDSLPVRLYTASDDPFTVPATADAFVAARPATIRTDVGALGHSETAIFTAALTLPGWLASL